MKRIWFVGSLMVAMMLSGAGSARAGGDPAYKAPVVVTEIGFEAALEGGVVRTSWKKYKRDDFLYYKLMRSSNPDPVYPDEAAVFVGTEPGQTSFEDASATPGTWNYRVCVITKSKHRWVSPVVTLKIDAATIGAEPPGASDFE